MTHCPHCGASLPLLTTRQTEIVGLLARGCSNQQMAEALIISSPGVKSHLQNIFGRLGVRGRVEAVEKARELNVI